MKQDQKSRIVEAAFDVWAQTHYTSTSLSLIAGRLSLTKQALYRYFPNKAAIIEAMGNSLLADFSRVGDAMEACAREIEASAKALSGQEILNQTLTTYVSAEMEFIRTNPNYYMFLTMYMPYAGEEVRSSLREIMNTQRRLLRRCLEPAVNPGTPESEWEILVFHLGLVTMLLSAFHFWGVDGTRHKDIEHAFTAHIQNAIGIIGHGLFPEARRDLDFERLMNRFAISREEMPPVDRLLTAVQEAVSENGVEMASLERIAEKVGISKSSLYFYFANKGEMFENMVRREQMHFNQLFKEKSHGIEGADEKIYGYMITLATYLIRNTAMLRMFEWLRSQRIHVRFTDGKRKSIEEPLEFLKTVMAQSPRAGGGLNHSELTTLLSAVVLWRIATFHSQDTSEEILGSICTIYRLITQGVAGSFMGKE